MGNYSEKRTLTNARNNWTRAPPGVRKHPTGPDDIVDRKEGKWSADVTIALVLNRTHGCIPSFFAQ